MKMILFVQAVYYLITGLWPIVSLGSFEAVTGPKTDDWLVKMVGLLAATIGAALIFGTWRGAPRGELLPLAVLGALSFTIIDVLYAVRGTISGIYLADAAVQIVFIMGLFAAALVPRKG